MEDNSQQGLRMNFGHDWRGHLWPVTLKSHPNHQVWGLKMQIPGPLSVTSCRKSGVGPKNLHLSCFPSDRSWRNLGLLVRLQLDFQGKASKATPIPLRNPLTTVGFLGVFSAILQLLQLPGGHGPGLLGFREDAQWWVSAWSSAQPAACSRGPAPHQRPSPLALSGVRLPALGPHSHRRPL